jgi:hypothetical protein
VLESLLRYQSDQEVSFDLTERPLRLGDVLGNSGDRNTAVPFVFAAPMVATMAVNRWVAGSSPARGAN